MPLESGRAQKGDKAIQYLNGHFFWKIYNQN